MTPIPLSHAHFIQLAPYARIAKNYTSVRRYKTAACMFTTPLLPVQAASGASRSLRDQYLTMLTVKLIRSDLLTH